MLLHLYAWPLTMTTDLDRTRYKALSFDCYGTQESGLVAIFR